MALDQPARKPFAIQINNAPAARPQTSLQHADVVYEAPTESSVTRFTAFFGSVLPDDIGPVRSVRIVALELIPMHDGILVYSGGSIDMHEALYQSDVPAIHAEGNGIAASRRDSDRVAPHNLYVSGPKLEAVADELGFGGQSTARSFTFGSMPSGGAGASMIMIPFSPGVVEYRYDSEKTQYQRYVDGEAHRDLLSDDPIYADNVVIIHAVFEYFDFVDDYAGETTLGVTLRGDGAAGVFREGRYFEALWKRPDLTDVFQFVHPRTGREISLRPGKTWFAIIPQWLGEITVDP